MTFDLSRRRLLTALGIASVPATATVALATAPAVIGEHSELLALGRQLNTLEADLEVAERERAAAIAQYDAAKPILHPDLVCPEYIRVEYRNTPWRNPDLDLTERLSDPVHDTRGEVHQFYSHQLRNALARLPKRSRSARAKWLRHRLALAEAHEAASEAAWREFVDRTANFDRLKSAIEKLAPRVVAIEPKTIQGVAIKARALIAATRVGSGYTKVWPAQQIGPGLAADIVRIARQA